MLVRKNDFGEHNSPYCIEAVNAAIEAADVFKDGGYCKALREICAVHGYSYVAFRRWLIRNGIKAYSSKYNRSRIRDCSGYAQIVTNLKKEQKELVDSFIDRNRISRTQFVNNAIQYYIKQVVKNERRKAEA
jgi:hypothetical protein